MLGQQHIPLPPPPALLLFNPDETTDPVLDDEWVFCEADLIPVSCARL